MAKGSKDKEAKAAAKAARKQASKERRTQLWQAFQIQRKEDKLLLPWMIGALIASIVVFLVIGLLVGISWYFLLPVGILVGVLAAFIIFGRRVQKSVYAKADGQAGAAAWALDNLQGSWRVTQAVAGTTQLDAVHRVVGRPGVILVGEGNAGRVKGLLAQEKKRVARLVGDTPIYEFVVGNDEGQVQLSQLQKQLNKLPRNIDTKRMDSIEARLAALNTKKAGAALPKGPLPPGAKMRSVQRTMRRR